MTPLESDHMIIWGWTGLSHDASLSVFSKADNLKLVWSAHSERYTRVKNDAELNYTMLQEALQWGDPQRIYYYENPLWKKTRQLYSGQYDQLTSISPTKHMRNFYTDAPRSQYTSHHRSHAAAGYYTAPFNNTAVLVIDSIGEWNTTSIWTGQDNKLKRKWSQNYPHSIGIWYSAMTQRIGLKPQEHEYILMGMAAIGDSGKYYELVKMDFIKKMPSLQDPRTLFKRNCHRGCLDWRTDLNSEQDYADIAAATQRLYEEILNILLMSAQVLTNQENIVIMGGCALNCVANSLAHKYFKDVWIMPNPGDAGSSIGCVLAHEQTHIKFPSAYLGHNIQGEYPVNDVIQQLKKHKIAAVAAGPAEFGPRSLGNRSILADPRGSDVKDRVNKLKKRELFRPFAPAILAEHASDYFQGVTGPYMQYTAKCKQPDKFPAIIHLDGTSRVQAVSKDDTSGFRTLLETWYAETGCPMLLNTSLNIRGEPLVNTRQDATRWTKNYGVQVCLPK